ncbi:DIE2/ALG10 family-domain-containing protein [Apiospora kogelbergensis]|uniref:DIE2/ALG10 family-domain-containing protein n=1 Tax=Apiospora kogelbergensis TaxID=1337665 RepID=UPI00312D728F
MESLTKALDLVLDQKFLLTLISGLFGVALWRFSLQHKDRGFDVNALVKFGLFNSVLLLFASVWVSYVNASVPAPYLDEFFHIPQTQVYCQGRYSQWDDKITTPPGLYLAAIAWARFVGKTDCSAQTLRQFNVVAIFWVSLFATFCRPTLKGAWSSALRSNFALHTGLNIALFPVLFFFSGLFYTDVLSTCIVLAAYSNHSARISGNGPPSWLNDVYTIALGVVALFMRQTNVFWVVVYMGGLEAVAALKSLEDRTLPDGPHFTRTHARLQLFPWKYTPGQVCSPAEGKQLQCFPSWYTLGQIYDPAVGDAWPGDLALCIASLVCGVLRVPYGQSLVLGPLRVPYGNTFTVLRRVYPQITTLALFVGFVIWNGGVVLGDKSNHVATLHLPQMLYIWPLFAFFSAPLFLPQVLRCLNATYRFVTGSSPKAVTSRETKPSSHEEKSALLRAFNVVFANGPILSALLVMACLMVGLVIVHFNTIIHPFTLADNRHYMFYVFRYSILRGSLVRHALVPAYVFCGWLSWSALYDSRPSWSACNAPSTTKAVDRKPDSSARKPLVLGNEVSQSPPTSTVIILLLTTALSLMTAPLVEPRYFILPWVFWRLLVPAWSIDDLLGTLQISTDKPSSVWLVRLGNRFDVRLVLESIWFFLINGITMYIFLTRPFYWKSEDGTLLDGGNIQRFMW